MLYGNLILTFYWFIYSYMFYYFIFLLILSYISKYYNRQIDVKFCKTLKFLLFLLNIFILVNY